MEVLPVTNIKYNVPDDHEWEYKDHLETEENAVIEALSKRLEAELRNARRTHLSMGEVLLPNGLTHTIAEDMFNLAESEPCGLRGCTLYIIFEMNELKTKLSTIKCDPTTPSTFEVYLTLRQSSAGWNFLPEFLKKITRSGTFMISPDYGLSKKKLYRSSTA